jgi:hypothetical protein
MKIWTVGVQLQERWRATSFNKRSIRLFRSRAASTTLREMANKHHNPLLKITLLAAMLREMAKKWEDKI